MGSNELNRLVIVGNGFDLAHGLKTDYKSFLDWYMSRVFNEFCSNDSYIDALLEINYNVAGIRVSFAQVPKTLIEVLNTFTSKKEISIKYKSNFFNRIISSFSGNNWVDIERFYFRILNSHITNGNSDDKRKNVLKLNQEFDFLIDQLTKYIKEVNEYVLHVPKLTIDASKSNFNKIFYTYGFEIKVINFNYTETLHLKKYIDEKHIIHIHGRVSDMKLNPIIFGYGDESDPAYQNIEDSGENVFLEHFKSFGYFKTDNYQKLLAYIDSSPYTVTILGHSCGLSDRVLLNEIFEHENCNKIDIFFYTNSDGIDNFKEITKEISRHFKPQNKNVMRRKIINKNSMNIIPQNLNS